MALTERPIIPFSTEKERIITAPQQEHTIASEVPIISERALRPSLAATSSPEISPPILNEQHHENREQKEEKPSSPHVLPTDTLHLEPHEYLPFAKEALQQMFLYRPPKEPLQKKARRRIAIVTRTGIFWWVGTTVHPLLGSALGMLSYVTLYAPHAQRNYLTMVRYAKMGGNIVWDSAKAIGVGIREHRKNKRSDHDDGFTLAQEVVWQYREIRKKRLTKEDTKNAKQFEKSHQKQIDALEKVFPRERFPGATREALAHMLRGDEFIKANRETVAELQRRYPQESNEQIMQRLEKENKTLQSKSIKETILKSAGIYLSSGTFFAISMLVLLHFLPFAVAGFASGLLFSFAARVVMPRVVEGIKAARKLFIEKRLVR